MLHPKEDEAPPGFIPHSARGCGGTATSIPSATTPSHESDCTIRDLFVLRTTGILNRELGSMEQQIAEGVSPSANSPLDYLKQKRKTIDFPGYDTHLLPGRGRRLPMAFPQPRSPALGTDLIDFNSIITAIKAKHGDIDKDMFLEAECMRKLNLIGVCKVVKELQKKKLEELDMSSLQSFYTIVRDAEKLKIDVKWLQKRLDDIREAIKSRDETKFLIDSKENLTMIVEDKKEKIKRLKLEIKMLEDEVTIQDHVIEELNGEINIKTSKFQHLSRSLTEGLI